MVKLQTSSICNYDFCVDVTNVEPVEVQCYELKSNFADLAVTIITMFVRLF